MLIKFGGIVTEGSGKIGGQIIQRGRSGAQMRNFTPPPRRGQPANTTPRAAFSNIASQWRFLDDAARLTWVDLAALQTRYNRYGDPYTPTGYQLFNELNGNLVYFGQTPIFGAAPALVALPLFVIDNLDLDSATSTADLSWTTDSVSTDWKLFVSAFKPQSPAISVPRGSSRWLAIDQDITSSPWDIWSAITKRFPIFPDSPSLCLLKVDVINVVTGQRLPPQFAGAPFQ